MVSMKQLAMVLKTKAPWSSSGRKDISSMYFASPSQRICYQYWHTSVNKLQGIT